MDLAQLQASLTGSQHPLPPVEQWHPSFCGDIDMQIKADGSWWYMGTPIGRQSLINLFSSVLKKENDDYFLVTPVEKVGIKVADVPFVITQWRQHQGFLTVATQQGDEVVVGPDHPIELRANPLSEDLLPYVKVRRNLWGRLHQNVFYQLVALGAEVDFEGTTRLMLSSGDYQFSLGNTSP